MYFLLLRRKGENPAVSDDSDIEDINFGMLSLKVHCILSISLTCAKLINCEWSLISYLSLVAVLEDLVVECSGHYL